jgi:transposase
MACGEYRKHWPPGRVASTTPDRLRRIKYRCPETGKYYVFLTNDFDLPALVIAEIYKRRWKIETFFRWIKQNLRIKEFYGYSDNAVRTQLWIAVSVYCLLAIIRKDLGGDREMGEIQEILTTFVLLKMPINSIFSRERPKVDPPDGPKQQVLPGFLM